MLDGYRTSELLQRFDGWKSLHEPVQVYFSLLRGPKDLLVSSYANALDDKHFSSNAGDAMRGRREAKYRENKSERSLCQISHDICTKGTISVLSVKTGQGNGRA